jgi:hypothetical protein
MMAAAAVLKKKAAEVAASMRMEVVAVAEEVSDPMEVLAECLEAALGPTDPLVLCPREVSAMSPKAEFPYPANLALPAELLPWTALQ